MKIIDNFLTKSYHDNILTLMSSSQFDWVYMVNITEARDAGKDYNEYGFYHMFWHEVKGQVDRFTPFIEPLLYQIMDVANCDLIWRARADMVTWTGKEDYIHPAHTDFPFPNTASVFYVNETDGDTIFYNV